MVQASATAGKCQRSDEMIETVKAIAAHARESIKNTGKKFYLFVLVLLLIIAWGLFNYLDFFFTGHGMSNLSDVVPWGIYISALAFFIGASAGATIIGLLIYGFGREDYKPMGTRAILLALFCIFGATQFVIADVGVPWRAMKVPFFLRNPTSMFFISSSSYFGFMALLSAELYFALKVTLGIGGERSKKMAKWLGIAAVPYALFVVHTFTGTIFGVVKAREFWNTPLLPIHFITSALASGVGIVILITIITSKLKKSDIVSKETYNHMGLMLGAFVTATLFLDLTDYLIIVYSATAEGMETWHILTHRFGPLLSLNIFGMIIAVGILLCKKGREVNGLFIASFLTVLAIGAYRINLVIVGQLIPLYPEMGKLEYIPNMPEIWIAVAIMALMILLYSLLSWLLPMEKKDLKTGESFRSTMGTQYMK
jgi:molybdopterin-containing oxidoreductase family membrane subunit